MSQTALIPLDQLEGDPDNPRKENDDDADDDLRASLAADGQLNDLIVVAMKDSAKKKVIAGNRRLRIMRLLGWTQARCREIEADEITLKKIKLIDNFHRVGPCDIDTAIYVVALMSQTGWSQKRAARELSLDQSVVSRWVTMVKKLSPDLRTSGLPGRVLYLLASKVKSFEEQITWAERVKTDGLTVDQLTALLNGKKAATNGRKVAIKVKGVKVTIDTPATATATKQEIIQAVTEALAQVKKG